MKTKNLCRSHRAALPLLALLGMPLAPSHAKDPQSGSGAATAGDEVGQTQFGEIDRTELGEAVGGTAEIGAGEIGQRQTRAQAAPNIDPLGRISTRVENRVQNRIRNRIDRDYDPRANAASPFENATEEARSPGRRARPR